MSAKCCGNCAHAMESMTRGAILCILNPPTPVYHPAQGVCSEFPSLYTWAKCDKFRKGTAQKQNSHGPTND